MKKTAFTLLEQLLVLLIVSLLILLSHQSFQRGKERYEEEHFIQAFETRYLFTQKMAIISPYNSAIYWKNNQKTFEFIYYEHQKSQNLHPLTVPTTVRVKKAPLTLTFVNISGHNGLLTEYIFACQASKKQITYTLQMGNGRYVKKTSAL